MKSNKVIRNLNIILKIVIITAGVAGLVCYWLGVKPTLQPWLPEDFHKVPSYCATIILAFAPEILRIFRVEVSDGLTLFYYLFLIPAMVLGIDLDWYKLIEGYDKVVHLASGALAVGVAKELIDNCYTGSLVPSHNELVARARREGVTLETIKAKNPQKQVFDHRFVWLMMVSVVGVTAVSWEIFEFLYDQICGGTMQQLISEGLDDTMWDMIAAMIGGSITALLIVCVAYRKRK